MKKPIMAWHFVGDRLRDGGPVPPDGEWLEHDGPIAMCKSGLHASIDPFDALTYAPGATLCRVECDGDLSLGNDKLVCTRRRIVKRIDSTNLLRTFARLQAKSVLKNWIDEVPNVVIEWLETGNEEIRSAAWAAAESAALSAALSAARSAAWAAARSAAWAAESAARSAARSAAESAARSAALSAACEQFNTMVDEAFGLTNEGEIQ